MDMSKQVIRVGCFSGNNGPQFYRKAPESTYEKLPVDYECTIPSPSIADARNMIMHKLQEKDNEENLP